MSETPYLREGEEEGEENVSEELAQEQQQQQEAADTLADLTSGTSYEDTTSLRYLSRDLYYNPLNPKTRKNLINFDQVKYALGNNARPSSTTGKRWTSVKVYNNKALNDAYVNPNEADTGLVINVIKKPTNGSGWDEVIEIKDITAYNPSHYAGGTAPTHSSKSWNVITSTHLEIRYNWNAFVRASGYSNIPQTHGVDQLELELIYTSGHIETMSIFAPVGQLYGTNMPWALTSQALSIDTNFIGQCDNKPGTAWYTKGSSYLTTYASQVGNYGVLTRYNAINDPSGTLQNYGLYSYYDNTGVTSPPTELVNGFNNYLDPLALEFGTNGITTPDQNQPAKQLFSRVDVFRTDNVNATHPQVIDGKTHNWFTTHFDIPTNIAHSTSSAFGGNIKHWVDTNYTQLASPTGLLSTLLNMTTAPNVQQYFTFWMYYSENITSCTTTPTTSYTVCDTVGNPSYWQTTTKDCSGNTIPAADLPGGANYANVTYVHNPSCCSSCSLTLSVTANNSTYGNTDGYVEWTAEDSSGNPTGTPYSTGGMYTVTIENASGVAVGTAAPVGGNTFTDATCDTTTSAGVAHLVGCDSNVKIIPGMQVSGTGIPTDTFVGAITIGTLSTNVTQFSLVDAAGTSVNATATNTNTTLTFATGSHGQHGALAPTTTANPYYTLCVSDFDNCRECIPFTLDEGAASSGCTDNTAVNYDSSAVVDDGSCMLCNATNGKLEDPISGTQTDLFDSIIFAEIEYATQISPALPGSSTWNSDGELQITASPVSSVIPYMEWDVNSHFKLTLYKVANSGDAWNSATATQIGSPVTTSTLAVISTATATFSSLAFGFYTCKIEYVDSNSTSTLENCWTQAHMHVRAEVCNDLMADNYDGIPSDPQLRYNNYQLCNAYPLPCCTLDAISYDDAIKGSTCNPIIFSEVECDPWRQVNIEWYYSPTGSAPWTLLGDYSIGAIYPGYPPTFISAHSNNDTISGTNWFTQTGHYKIVLTGMHMNGAPDTCIEEIQGYFTFPATGCTDPVAANYDPNAICNSGCVYPSWDCINGSCIDPYPATGPYTTLAACQNNCTPPPTGGCTDTCATNYDPTAAYDDGSCTYTACLDPSATNQYTNCCLGSPVPTTSVIGADNSCCIIPCGNPNTVSTTTTDSTGTCTVFNADGTVNATVTINTGASTWTWEIYDTTGTLIYTDPTTYNSGDTSNTYTTLMYGVYEARITDSNGCLVTQLFVINSSGPNVGCTDPNASNYDPTAVCDCCCLYCGCMDPNASNYNPNANTPCQCDYPPLPPNVCVPDSLEDDLLKIRACLTSKGTDWLTKYKTGRADDCTLLNKWKLILVTYLLEQDDLSCLFNCANVKEYTSDSNCHQKWVDGGLSTGANHDPNHMGTLGTPAAGEGTTIITYDDYPNGWFGYQNPANPSNPYVVHTQYSGPARSNLTYVGDVVKFDLPTGHPLAAQLNGSIWTLTTLPPAMNTWNTNGGHQGCKNQKISHYTICQDYRHRDATTTTNYYDNFINFANKFCQDCNISILKDERQKI